MKSYVHIPNNKAYYKPQENCCYEIVSYDPDNLGVTEKIDKPDDKLNSWDLLCRCNLHLPMIPITEEEYMQKKAEVLAEMEKRGKAE